MLINLDPLFNTEGYCEDFSYDLDLSDETFAGEKPFRLPALVKGKVYNSVGIAKIEAKACLELSTECDRCAKAISVPVTANVNHTLVRTLNNDDNDEFILVEDAQLNLDELVREDIFLQLPNKFLCSEDCKGLCPTCGKDLNEGPCSCKKEVDPRLAVLQQLLDN